MATLNCYFCNLNEEYSFNHKYFNCKNCMSKYGLDNVISMFNNSFQICEIDINLTINNISYDVCIRNIDSEPYTIIYLKNKLNIIFSIEGIPFNPSNIKNKLSTYFLFI